MKTRTILIDALGPDVSDAEVRQLAAILLDAVDDNAGVSFMRDLTLDQAIAWWRSILRDLDRRGAVVVARLDGEIVGTVQLQPSWAPNQPHRADVAKLMVHRRARRQGIARRLMERLQQIAAANGFTLLLLDTRKGDTPERLYQSMGWTRAGEVPNFALNPDGSLCATVFYWKQL